MMRLDPEKLALLFEKEGKRALVFPEIDSTNSYAKRSLAQGKTPPDLILSLRQTGGRGRLGRSFYSPEGAGLYFSFVYPAQRFPNPDLITPAAALAVKRSVEKECRVSLGIKWVNDLYRGGKKVCGILCESASGHVVIGVGINFTHPSVLPEEIKTIYGVVGKEPPDPARFLLSLSRDLDSCFQMPRSELVSEYRKAVFHLGREVEVVQSGDVRKGVCADLDENLHLVVRFGDRTETLSSGEISLKI